MKQLRAMGIGIVKFPLYIGMFPLYIGIFIWIILTAYILVIPSLLMVLGGCRMSETPADWMFGIIPILLRALNWVKS